MNCFNFSINMEAKFTAFFVFIFIFLFLSFACGQIILWDITNHSDRLRSHRQSHGQSKKNSMNSLVSSGNNGVLRFAFCQMSLKCLYPISLSQLH